MKQQLTYDDIKRKVEQINKRIYDYEQPFFNTVDDILDESEGKHVTSVLTESLEKLLAQVNREIETIEKEINVTPTCQVGCAHCCYFPIIVTRLEVKLMLMYIAQQQKERKQVVLQQIRSYLHEHSSILNDIKMLDFRKDQEFKRKYKELALPCVFLNLETSKCMAYEVRPIPCRTYTNYVDVSVCEKEVLPKEPVSYEFLHRFYVQGMDEVIQEILEVVEDKELGFSYPADAGDVNYLPVLLQEELESLER
ncbi:YkgJ family cysteine cluster protein [Halalkalibacter kiskunsagensis]|uniref:YkgJ family cysteine cluster protein n=1 Tax=Halalkalibacter kiskunsagensis TaxID=1548599 RepID=A0ABV6KCX3_9BACI